MNLGIAVLAFVAAMAPLSAARRTPQLGPKQSAIACVTVLTLFMLLAIVADPLLASLDVSDPTMVIGAGLTLVITSAVRLIFVRRATSPDDVGPDLSRGAAPIAFPLLSPPALGVVTLAASVELGWFAPALLCVPPLLLWRAALGRPDALLAVASGLVTVFGIFAGVALAVDGIFAL